MDRDGRQVGHATGRRFVGAPQRVRRGGRHAQGPHVRGGEGATPKAWPIADLRGDRGAHRRPRVVVRCVRRVGRRPPGRGAGKVRRRRRDPARACRGHGAVLPPDADGDAGFLRGGGPDARAVRAVLAVTRAHRGASCGDRPRVHRASPQQHPRRVELPRHDGRARDRRADAAVQRPGGRRERPRGARTGGPQRRSDDDPTP